MDTVYCPMYLQFFYSSVFFMYFQVVLCVQFPRLCSTNYFIQVLLVDLVHGCFQVIPQTLVTEVAASVRSNI